MKAIIQESLAKSCTYEQYRNIIHSLIGQGLSSGEMQSEELLNYSVLNETRMNRLDKTIQVPDEIKTQMQDLKNQHIWLVLSEGWCGDAAQLLPVFNKMAEVTPNIDLHIVFRDDNPELMAQFLTNSSRSIPKLIVINKESLEVEGQYGPRPIPAAELVRNYKEKHGVIDEQLKTDLQLWYLHDKGLTTMKELADLMKIADR
jgi:hypothetical protein